MKRRKFLKGIGVVSVSLIGGAVYRARQKHVFSSARGIAFEPWTNWQYDEIRGPVSLIRSAILAASPYNSQPWLFQIKDNQINLFADINRNLGVLDGELRKLYIGLGCALENLLIAARANGYETKLKIMPDRFNHTFAATVELKKIKVKTTDAVLYHAIPNRRTHRGPHDNEKKVSIEQLKSMENLVKDLKDIRLFWLTGDAERKRFCDDNLAAARAIIVDSEQAMERRRWERMTHEDVESHRDGLTIESYSLPMALKLVAKVFPESAKEVNHKYFLNNMLRLYASTDVFGLIAVKNLLNNNQQLRTGRAWQRLNLWGTSQELSMGPVTQISQRAEREQLQGLDSRYGGILKDMISDPKWNVLLPFRVGYPLNETYPSPRREMGDVILKSKT